jgi:hypothetical protein
MPGIADDLLASSDDEDSLEVVVLDTPTQVPSPSQPTACSQAATTGTQPSQITATPLFDPWPS